MPNQQFHYRIVKKRKEKEIKRGAVNATCGFWDPITDGSMFSCADCAGLWQPCGWAPAKTAQVHRQHTRLQHVTAPRRPKARLVFHYVMMKHRDLTRFFPLFYLAVLFLRGSPHGFCGPARADIVARPCVGVSPLWAVRVCGSSAKPWCWAQIRKEKKPRGRRHCGGRSSSWSALGPGAWTLLLLLTSTEPTCQPSVAAEGEALGSLRLCAGTTYKCGRGGPCENQLKLYCRMQDLQVGQ